MQVFKLAGRSQMTDPTKPPIDLSGLRTLPLDSLAAPAEQKPLQPGQIFAGRYKIEAAIGEGGAGAIYRAIDETSEEAVALKVLRAGLAPTPEARKRLVRRGPQYPARQRRSSSRCRSGGRASLHGDGVSGRAAAAAVVALAEQPRRGLPRSSRQRDHHGHP